MIKLENVYKTYCMGHYKLNALNNVSVHIKEGEFVTLMGKSGSGKSTLLNMLGCLDSPTQGEYLLDRKEISKYSDEELSLVRNRNIGFVFQSFNLLGNLSILENVELPMIYSLKNKKERKEIAIEYLKKVDLGDRIHHKPTELSGGQIQRAAIARSLVNNPKIILADEPTGNLDSNTGMQILELFKMLHKEGKTIVMVTHDQSISKISQRNIVLSDGKIIKYN